MKNKVITNDIAFKNLLKNIDSVSLALLRERILVICEYTAEESKNWENSLISPNLYTKLNEIVKLHLGFEDNN